MKMIFIVFIFIALAQSIADRQILQFGLNGAFWQNNLAQPSTIMPCVDDATAHDLVIFIGDFLAKAAVGSTSDLNKIFSVLNDFIKEIPQPVQNCLKGNKQRQYFYLRYGIDIGSNMTDINNKWLKYLTLHYLQLHKWFGDTNIAWKAGTYYQVGYSAATLAHKVLNYTQSPNLADRQILQQVLNGAFQQNDLPVPKTIMPCVDDDTAHDLVIFIKDFLAKAAIGSVRDFGLLLNVLNSFIQQIPQPVQQCLYGNEQRDNLYAKYGLNTSSNITEINKKYFTYFNLHFLQLHKFFGETNTAWLAGKYYDSGYSTGTLVHKILGNTQQHSLSDQQILQQALKGGFQQNKLPAPTTVIECIDDDTAHTLVVFITTVLAKAAKGSASDFVDIVNMVKNFTNQIPQDVKDCLYDNQQFMLFLLKYNIDSTTDFNVIEKKCINYVTLHYLQVHKWAVQINGFWIAGKYYEAGFNSAIYTHKVLGSQGLNQTNNAQIIEQPRIQIG